MKSIRRNIGRVGYWLSWPVLYVVWRGSLRTRVLVVARGKVLVVRETLGGGKRWSLPGGGVRTGEKTLACAIREVYEETGISLLPKQLRSLGVTEHDRHGIEFRIERFIARLERQLTLCPNRLEILEAQWLKPAELTRANVDSDTLSHIAAWKKHR